ncbi:MAG TPA: hypothetical protein VFC76_05595 [Oscillospiraceae bacterium]|nr:hypothetical protein [Oscillospiraceae bacterium]
MRNSKANASRFIVTVMFLIVTALSGFPFIKVLVDRLWISNIDTLPLHIMSLIPTTESSITATGIISIIIFIISIISMTALNYKLMDIPTMVGVWLLPFLFITVLFYSDSSFVKILSFIVIAVCIFIFIEIIGIMRKNPENYYITKGKNPSFIFYIIYIFSAAASFIGFTFSQLFKLNKTTTTAFGILLFTGIILKTFSSFWFLIHSQKNFFVRSLMFAGVFLYTMFFSIKWHYVSNIKNSDSATFCIVLLLISGGFSIFQYKKLVQVMQIEK